MVQLLSLFGNRKLMQLLSFFLDNPSLQLSYTQLQKRTKLSKATLTKWLSHLCKENCIVVKEIGRNKLYNLNRNQAWIKQLKILFNLQQLAFLTRIASEKQVEIYLYGSAARGEDTEQSDYDVLIIGNITREEVFSLIEAPAQKLKRPLQFQIFTALQWTQLPQKDAAFYHRIEQEKIALI